jgi:hypothetical protein
MRNLNKVIKKSNYPFKTENIDVWVISKLHLDFIWFPLKGYYYNEKMAQEACENLNKIEDRIEILSKTFDI